MSPQRRTRSPPCKEFLHLPKTPNRVRRCSDTPYLNIQYQRPSENLSFRRPDCFRQPFPAKSS
ncbi:hypothetical protein [Kingella potus]|uniref:hypothetical protein n=1 Tax=Kingella potus TaxID=265175 RepID=UPI001FD30065|nr:hypothetical protein [Kingella potus]UOP00963.1 hypothetical protein LVJ84_00665 [Kingella potus]